MMSRWLRLLLAILFLRPVAFMMLGLTVKGRENLPKAGPAIVIANHNSHLDTLVLLSLMPLGQLDKVRPVAAADYFLKNPVIAWFSLHVLNILPLDRTNTGRGADPLAEGAAALDRGEILIVFPEGSRGSAEVMGKFKGGVARLKERYPDVPVTPVFLQGAGKALPRGEIILVPVVVDAVVGTPVAWTGNRATYTQAMEDSVRSLGAHLPKVFDDDED
ncbi:lysophospholipid acyltransferase family protein [Dongia rigui]|uniref:Lysophospholipid acyltransferase family protein n=1 Tax=Dongia rigui TaxID=940149 RepID=A0ABU5DZU2_9PROT|nr:lysophospholipid acyltransferase family protein [Dongia rigui]MDY0872728.1 lysophospholipid acyltransferase family protein [Dongia rigui]